MRFAPGTDPEVIRRAEEAFYGKRRQDQPMQAALSAQQALPQPQMPPELQRIQAMGLSLQSKLQNDSFLQGIRQQQEKLGATVQQRQRDYLGSIQQFFNNAPPELKRFLSSPRVMQNINMAYADSQQLQPEFAQMRDLSQQYNQYVQTNYGEEQRRLQELQQQALPQIQQYQNQLFNQQQQAQGTPPPPGGYTPTQNFESFKQGQPIGNLFGIFGGQGTPPPQQEAPPPEAYYNGKLRNKTRGGGYLPYGYMLGPSDQIIRDPKVPDSEVEPSDIQTGFDPSQPRDPRFVPPTSIDPKVRQDLLERIRPQPEVNPGRTTIPRPQPSVNPGMVTPKFEPPTPSIIQDPTRTPKPPTGVPQVPKVPKRPTRGSPTGTPKAPVKTKPLGGTKPRPKPIERGQESTGPAVKGVMSPKPVRKPPTMPNVDPERIKTTAPKKPKGLGNRPKNPNVPSAFQGINTNINRQRQDMR